jgi:hypothetical protein
MNPYSRSWSNIGQKYRELQKTGPERLEKYLSEVKELKSKIDSGFVPKAHHLRQKSKDLLDESNEVWYEELLSMSSSVEKLLRVRTYVQNVLAGMEYKDSIMDTLKSSPKEAVLKFRAWVNEGKDFNEFSDKCQLKYSIDDIKAEVYENLSFGLLQTFAKALSAVQWPKPLEQIIVTREARSLLFKNISIALEYSENLFLGSVKNEEWVQLAKCMHYLYLLEDYRTEKPVLLLMENLVEPIIARFRYHFSGNRKTHRLDKPEWFFSFINEAVKEHLLFIREIVQKVFDHGSSKFKIPQRSALDEFILAFMKAVTEKIIHYAKKLFHAIDLLDASVDTKENDNLTNSSVSGQIKSSSNECLLLLHLVHECVQFDLILKNSYKFNSKKYTSRWIRFTEESETVILTNHSEYQNQSNPYDGCCLSVFTMNGKWFANLVDVEKRVAMEKFRTIIESARAWDLHYLELGDEDEFKAAHSSVRLIDLLENMTENYKHFARSEQRLIFFENIQTSLIDGYLERIEMYLMKYESNVLSSTTTLTSLFKAVVLEFPVPVDLKEKLPLTILARWISSLTYVALVLKRWGESLFFLELQEARSLVEENTGSFESIFGSKVADYYQLINDVQDSLIRSILKELNYSFRPYEKKRNWTFISFPYKATSEEDQVESDQSPTELTSEFVTFLLSINKCFDAVYEQLPRSKVSNVFQKVVVAVMDIIDTKLLGHARKLKLSKQIAKQTLFDYKNGLIKLVIDNWLSKANLESSKDTHMRR